MRGQATDGGSKESEFPGGNGEVGILIEYAGRRYALELKSYTHEKGYGKALARSPFTEGSSLGLPEVSLVFFVEYIDDASREKYEKVYTDEETGVRVTPSLVDVGNEDNERMA